MTKIQSILLSISTILLIGLFVYVVYSKHGYADLLLLRQEQAKLIQKNERLARENFDIGIEIDRLKYDFAYIENIARQELGMIKKDEIILKPAKPTERKK